MSEVKIVFTPSGRQGQIARGTNLLQAARQLGVDIDSVCGGRAMCGRCQIDVGEGQFAKHGIPHLLHHSVLRQLQKAAMQKNVNCQLAVV